MDQKKQQIKHNVNKKQQDMKQKHVQNKTNNFIKFMAKLQRGLFLRPNSRYSVPKSSNKK